MIQHDWLRSLRSAKSFEEAAQVILRTSLLFMVEAGYTPMGGSVHLRPDAGYEGLVRVSYGAEAGAEAGTEEATDVDLRPSTAAWRMVSRSGQPTVLDVFGGSLKALGAEKEGITLRLEEVPSALSIARLKGREATHCLSLPLINLEGEVAGMVSLDLRAMMWVGAEGAFEDVLSELQLRVDVAAPYLLSRPVQDVYGPLENDLLPVVGERMTQVIGLLQVFSKQPGTLLIQGETGVGKSRLARWCHHQSPWSTGPCVLVNLLSLPEDTQLAELVGWRRGAFPSAHEDHEGFVGRAKGGTLFLDEIGSLSLKAQGGLLELLEEGIYRPIGAQEGLPVEARIVVGANQDLMAAVQAGTFREDLYYRINVLPMTIPPLRERRGEIGLWAAYLLKRRHQALAFKEEISLSPEAVNLLKIQPWPGNLRQLDNVLQRAHAICLVEGMGEALSFVILPHHITQAVALDGPSPGQGGVLGAMESAATAFVEAALKARDEGATLSLDHWRAFEGVLLERAIDMTGSAEAALRLLGREAMLEGRNHHKLLRRAKARKLALAEVLSE